MLPRAAVFLRVFHKQASPGWAAWSGICVVLLQDVIESKLNYKGSGLEWDDVDNNVGSDLPVGVN